jgi:hypothetical protein
MLSVGQKLLHIRMVNMPVLVTPLFLKFLLDFVLQMLLIHPVVILVNRLAWRNKFRMKQCLHSQKKDQHALDV